MDAAFANCVTDLGRLLVQANVVNLRAVSGVATATTVPSALGESKEQYPQRLIAWLDAGIIAAAYEQQAAEGGKELRSLQNFYQALVSNAWLVYRQAHSFRA